ncbi:MAG: 1-deoxy-D-xylulose-5-phosphate synthase [Candidatus Puniceispirillaceae bacterium]
MAKQNTPLLDHIQSMSDLRALPERQLAALAQEVREEMIAAVSQTGGHLGAGLGVVELTVALHYVFNTPDDRLIWDVGHQAYPHKILTGRRDRIHTLRQTDGLSGFTKRTESDFDPFGAGHSSTSISAGYGMAVARDLKRENKHVISVIGDGAMSAGMAYEAMNNAGADNSNLIVILNDNDMSIAQPVGALSSYLSNLITSKPYQSLRGIMKDVASRFPAEIEQTARRAHSLAKEFVGAQTLFSQLGFFHIGPVDGHDMSQLLPILKNLRDGDVSGPVLVHVITEKGKGHPFAGPSHEKYHAVPKFDVVTGEQIKPASNIPNYTSVFAQELIKKADNDESVVAITAAMPSGTGIDKFKKAHPRKSFDVGIAEQHAVTFAAGLASEGMKPFVAIYSTFLQRGYDQLVHDVAIQNLPVRFIIDRAGLVGADGATHGGVFDLAYLSCLPNMMIMCPSDEAELVHMMEVAAIYDDGPCALRFPRGEGRGVTMPDKPVPMAIGQGRILQKGSDLAILSLGTILEEAEKAAAILAQDGLSVTLADARFAKPFDVRLIRDLVAQHKALLIVEEGSPGGFSAHILQFMANEGLLSANCNIRVASIKDDYIDHDSRPGQLAKAGIDAEALISKARQMLGTNLQPKSSQIEG